MVAHFPFIPADAASAVVGGVHDATSLPNVATSAVASDPMMARTVAGGRGKMSGFLLSSPSKS
ncbi:MAG: hypothetical protein AB7E29_07460 [Xanthobacter sp.]